MARWGSFDFESLKQLQKNLQALEGEAMDEFMTTQANKLGGEVLRRTKKRTPVSEGAHKVVQGTDGSFEKVRTRSGGHLRRNWKLQPVSKVGNSYEVTIYNSVDYAPYVEFGHRQTPGRFVPVLGKRLVVGWVPGVFMLKKSVDEIKKNLSPYLEKQMIRFLERGLK